MELEMPYVSQPAGSVWCGAASAAMVLKFFGKKISLKRIAEELSLGKSGVNNARLASYFLGYGLDVTVQAWPSGMPSGILSKNPLNGEAAIQALKRGLKEGTKCKTRILCRELVALAKRGGNIVLQPVALEDFRIMLESRAPIIACVDAKHFSGFPRQAGHYVVVYGITDADSQVTQPYVYVRDPDRGPSKFISVKNLLDACNSWFGSVIYISHRK